MMNVEYEVVYRLYDKAIEGLGLSRKVLCRRQPLSQEFQVKLPC